MGIPALSDQYTAEMVRALNDQHDWGWPRYEVVDGKLLVTPAPRFWHQEIIERIHFALRAYLRVERVGHPLVSPADISWGPNKLVQPDVFVMPLEDARKYEWAEVRQLLLAVEVSSPGSVRADRLVKRGRYQREGVPLYWIVDADAHTAEVWTPRAHDARLEREVLAWHPEGASEPFMLPLAELFQPL